MVTIWQKLSGSINFYIRDVWQDKLLKTNEELLEEYLSYFDDGNGNLEYLDKTTFEYIKLKDDDVERIKKAFIERIDKKKIKYADEIKGLEKEREEKANRPLAKVIEFPKR